MFVTWPKAFNIFFPTQAPALLSFSPLPACSISHFSGSLFSLNTSLRSCFLPFTFPHSSPLTACPFSSCLRSVSFSPSFPLSQFFFSVSSLYFPCLLPKFSVFLFSYFFLLLIASPFPFSLHFLNFSPCPLLVTSTIQTFPTPLTCSFHPPHFLSQLSLSQHFTLRKGLFLRTTPLLSSQQV